MWITHPKYLSSFFFILFWLRFYTLNHSFMPFFNLLIFHRTSNQFLKHCEILELTISNISSLSKSKSNFQHILMILTLNKQNNFSLTYVFNPKVNLCKMNRELSPRLQQLFKNDLPPKCPSSSSKVTIQKLSYPHIFITT